MKTVLILGSHGMAGHMIYDYLESLNKYNIVTIARKNIPTEPTYTINVKQDLKLLKLIFKMTEPDIIINCIGILVKACEKDPTNAIWLNSYFPHWLSKNTKGKVIHLSTDCVFSGKKGAYKDTDIKDGIGIYAKTKALGEIITKKDLTIRMSIIGNELKKKGMGLFEWFICQKGTIKGYSKCFWSGLTTLELAKAIDKLIDSDITGLYQLAPNYKISKYDLLCLIRWVWNKRDNTILKYSLVKHDKSLINSSTPIPNYIMPSSYEIMLHEMKEFIERKKL